MIVSLSTLFRILKWFVIQGQGRQQQGDPRQQYSYQQYGRKMLLHLLQVPRRAAALPRRGGGAGFLWFVLTAFRRFGA